MDIGTGLGIFENWYQTGDHNEQDPYSANFIPSDGTLNDWMGRGWIDWTCRFGYRSY